jgi:hypothetical protein
MDMMERRKSLSSFADSGVALNSPSLMMDIIFSFKAFDKEYSVLSFEPRVRVTVFVG